MSSVISLLIKCPLIDCLSIILCVCLTLKSPESLSQGITMEISTGWAGQGGQSDITFSATAFSLDNAQIWCK